MTRTVGRFGGQEWSRAFSLVEVVIALGVVSVSVFAILGLLPVGYKDASDSRRETCSAFIAQQIIGDLRSSPFNAATILCRGSDGKLTALQTTFDLSQSGTYVLACDAQDNILRQLGSGTYDSPYTTADTAFLARVNVIPAGSSSRVEVEVSAPPAAASATRSRFGFVTTVGGGS
jgi:uncharacterized protein (TIGR02598 family)